MTPRTELSTLAPAATASDALKLLAERRINQVPGVEDDRLLGLVTREAIVTWRAVSAPAAADLQG